MLKSSRTITEKKKVVDGIAKVAVEKKPILKSGAAVSVGDSKRAGSSGRSGSKLPPVAPGKILKERLMEPNGLTANKLAKLLDVSPTCVAEIIKGRREITTNTAARLGRCFGMSAQFWLNLQMRYDLEVAEDEHLFERIDATVTVFRPATA